MCTSRCFIEPDLPDEFEPAGHGPTGATEAVGDLIAGVALHPADRDLAQHIVAETAEHPVELLGDERGELRRRFRPDDELEAALLDIVPVMELDLSPFAAPTLQPSTARRCAYAFRAVMSTKSRQRSSRSASTGNCPRAPHRRRSYEMH